MASRTKQKAEARARRVGEEKAQLERNRRRERVLVLSGVVLGAVVAVAVAIVISSGGGASTGLKPGSGEAKMAAQIRQSGATLGNAKAPLTMTYYSDLQCPVCADFTLNSGFPELIAKDVRTGKVRIVYRAFETATRDPQTFQTQQVAALAAGKQSHFWDYGEGFYRQQGTEDTGYVTDSYLTGLADQISGLNLSSWRSSRRDSAADQTGAIRAAGCPRGRGSGHADADLPRPAREGAVA